MLKDVSWVISLWFKYVMPVNPVDTGCKLNVNETFRIRPWRVLNVLCAFNLRPVSTGNMLVFSLKLFIKVEYRAVIYLFEVNNANTRNVWNLFYINNKDTPVTLFWCIYCWLWTDFTPLFFPLFTMNNSIPAEYYHYKQSPKIA